MPVQAPQWSEYLSCPVCQNDFEVSWQILLRCANIFGRYCSLQNIYGLWNIFVQNISVCWSTHVLSIIFSSTVCSPAVAHIYVGSNKFYWVDLCIAPWVQTRNFTWSFHLNASFSQCKCMQQCSSVARYCWDIPESLSTSRCTCLLSRLWSTHAAHAIINRNSRILGRIMSIIPDTGVELSVNFRIQHHK